MHARHQTTFDSFLSCPKCQGSITMHKRIVQCNHCKREFSINNDVPILLIENSMGQHNTSNTSQHKRNPVKEKAKNQFITIAESLKNNPLNRFIKFLNYGYIDIDDNNTTKLDKRNSLLNKNQKQLLKKLTENHCLTNKVVLEIGCGRGGNIEIITKEHSPKLTIGMDIAEANIQFCKKQYSLPQTYFIVGDAEKVPLISNKIDAIINIESSYAYTNIFNFYDSVYRLLKMGGYFLYTDIFDSVKIKKYETYLENLGFKIISNIDITQNVLASLRQLAKSYLVSNSKLAKEDIVHFNEVSAVPGSDRFKKMKQGIIQYRLYQLTKNF